MRRHSEFADEAKLSAALRQLQEPQGTSEANIPVSLVGENFPVEVRPQPGFPTLNFGPFPFYRNHIFCVVIIQPKRFSMKVIFGAKSAAKTVCTTFTPPPRIVEKK